jgi:hypothetical protein
MATVTSFPINTISLDATAVRQQGVPYANKAEAEGASILSVVLVIRLLGFRDSNDGGGALYKRVGSQPSHPGRLQSADGAWWEIADDVINVRMLGAVVEDAGDSTQAFHDTRSVCAALGRTFHIPSGTYNLASIAASIDLWEGAIICGDGPTSIVRWNDSGSVQRLFWHSFENEQIANVTLRDFTVRGNQDTDPLGSDTLAYPFVIFNVSHVIFERVQSIYPRGMGIVARNCDFVEVKDCVVDHAARDGINVAGCRRYSIIGNRVSYCDDDAIAAHTQTHSSGVLDIGGVIANNYIFASQGIKALGAASLSISGNTLDFTFSNAIDVQPLNSGSEGRNASQGISITGNVVRNHISRAGIDNLNQNADYIFIGGSSAQAGDGGAIPGWNDTSTGTVVDPYGAALNSYVDSDTPIMPSTGIVISGNVFQRTVAPVAKFSDYGYGSFHTRNGEIDPEITTAMFQGAGVRFIGGYANNVKIIGNVMAGMGRGVYVTATSTVLSGFDIADNTIFDTSLGAVVIGAGVSFATANYIRGNIIDCDPYHKNENRGADGSWAAEGNLTALIFQSSGGWLVQGNVFRNSSRISDSAIELSAVNTFTPDNVCEGKPDAYGFSTSNLGIGTVPRGSSVRWRVVECDPNSSDFRKLINTCFDSASSIPTSGIYVLGHFVRKSNPSVGSSIGWLRLTTGSGHTLGTDWMEVAGAASTTQAGVVELATDAEATAGSDTARAITPANLAAAAIKQGRHSRFFAASEFIPRTTNGAARGLTETSTNDAMLDTLDFDQSTQEGATLFWKPPKSWNRGTISFRFFWTADAGTAAQTFEVELDAVAISDDDALDATWGTAVGVSDALIATGDLHISDESSAVTVGGSPADGDAVMFRIKRDVSNDDLAADGRVLGVEVFFTTNAPNDA